MSKMTTKRVKVVLIILYAVIIGIVCKLGYIQLINGQDMETRALNSRLKEIEVKANRGVIYDRNDNALAISVATESIYITPSQIRGSKSPTAEEIAVSLAGALEMELEKVQGMIAKNTAFEWVKRHATDEQVALLRELDLPGVGFLEEFKRSYPKNTLACHIIGFAGVDNQGLNGVELKYDDVLKGTPGRLLIERDAKNRDIPQAMQAFIPATPGYDLHLTLDETIQYVVEREIEKVFIEQQAEKVTAIVMDIKTGAVLAMANLPNYDSNSYGSFDPKSWNNTAVSGIYEPGSTFKILTASMFLEEGATLPEDRYYCAGYQMVGKQRVKCWYYPRAHGSETFVEGVANSCNPVFIQVMMKLGADAFYEYVEGFGMGQKTGIDVPGEAYGIMVPQSRVIDLDLASMSIGQSNAFTPIQMITAISAVANNGVLMKPYVVDRITDAEGNIIEQTKPTAVRQVISEKTAQQMWGILENVVSSGTGSKGKIEGYQIAGKTGTAQKIKESGGYGEERIVSFAGFAPANDPQVACIVIVDNPKFDKMGGVVSGPVFKNILEDTLRYLEVPKTMPLENRTVTEEKIVIPDIGMVNAVDGINAFVDAGLNPVVMTQGPTLYAYLPPAQTEVTKGAQVQLYCGDPESEAMVVPDLTGKTIREVDRIMSALGFRVTIEGSGLAETQNPVAGTILSRDSVVQVWFNKANGDLESELLDTVIEEKEVDNSNPYD